MPTVRPGQETVLAWSSGAIDCRVIAAAGAFVLLRPVRMNSMSSGTPEGRCSLTFLDGLIPMGWDGAVEPGTVEGEYRFRVADGAGAADRRSSVRLPTFLTARVTHDGLESECRLLDISAGGARLSTPVQLPRGETVRLRAALDDSLELDADAIVRNAQPVTAAVEFVAHRGAGPQEIGAWTVARLRASLTGQG
jgi:hypothetical protein